MQLVKQSTRLASALAVIAVLAIAPAAQAAGTNSGGVNSGGANTGGGGGVTKPTCVPLTFTANAGFNGRLAAIWAVATIPTCAEPAGSTGSWVITFHNDTTGQLESSSSGTYTMFNMLSGANTVGVDYETAAFNSQYTVAATFTDSAGKQSTASVIVQSPKPHST